MKPTGIIKTNYSRNFVIFMLLIILIGTTISALTLYFNIHKPLDTHYSAALTLINNFKDTLITKTLKINLIFFLLIAGGVGILTLLYTHRISGPLYRIRVCSKLISEGNLNTEVKLRQKDAISAFADSLNEMTNNYSSKVILLNSELYRLKNTIKELRLISDKNNDAASESREIISLNEKIRNIIKTIKT